MKKKLVIGDLEQVGTCEIATRHGRMKWPVFMIVGLWGLTPPPQYGTRKPSTDKEWMDVTHLPTGFRGGDVRVNDPRKRQKLAKYAQMFGGACTVDGVQRKYRKLSKYQKLWIKRQVAWLLPSKAVRAFNVKVVRP
jgi:hypothetical protein